MWQAMNESDIVNIQDDYSETESFSGLKVIDGSIIEWKNQKYKNAPIGRLKLSGGAESLLEDIYVSDIIDLIIKGLYNGELYDSMEYIYIDEIRNALFSFLECDDNIENSAIEPRKEGAILGLRKARWKKIREDYLSDELDRIAFELEISGSEKRRTGSESWESFDGVTDEELELDLDMMDDPILVLEWIKKLQRK